MSVVDFIARWLVVLIGLAGLTFAALWAWCAVLEYAVRWAKLNKVIIDFAWEKNRERRMAGRGRYP